MIEGIEGVQPELKLHAFGDRKRLAQRQIPARLIVRSNATEAQREGAHIRRELAIRITVEAYNIVGGRAIAVRSHVSTVTPVHAAFVCGIKKNLCRELFLEGARHSCFP